MIACLDIKNDWAIMELRPLKDEVISRISMDFDGFESIFQASLLKSVHVSIKTSKLGTFDSKLLLEVSVGISV